MGCSESKDKNTITVKTAQDKLFETTDKILTSSPSSASSGMGSSASTSSGSKPSSSSSEHHSKAASDIPVVDNLEDDYIKSTQNSNDNDNDIATTLEAIPDNDLGESLDARKMMNFWSRSHNAFASTSTGTFSSNSSRHDIIPHISASSSAKSIESSDSGVYELDDNIITENSPPEIVQRIEREFTPVENLDLTITGKACPRLLSGSQRVRQQEQDIMESLRQEGFISTAKQKSAGGLSFEVTEDTLEAQSAGGKIKPMNFLPRKHKEHLEKQISKFHLKDLTPEDVERRQFLAEERRKLEMDAKLDRLSHLTSKSNIDSKIEEIKRKKDQKEDAAIEKREAHLKELRDKLKTQNQKAKQIKLKKLINGPPVPVPYKPVARRAYEDEDFFQF